MTLYTSSATTINARASAQITTANTRPASMLASLLILAIASLAMLFHGPIAQLPGYHDFADQRTWMGISNAGDVLSNAGFALVGIAGLALLWQRRKQDTLQAGWSAYALFFISVLLTALGSGWYHLAPDNARLVWDRLPIALACGGILAAVWHETVGRTRWLTPALALFAIASVLWWRVTDLQGLGDLRPYLLLQVLPLVLIPLLQWQAQRPRFERAAFGIAIGLYVLAKLCEIGDHHVLELGGLVSGHTVKHLLATLAAGMVAWQVWRRE